MLCCRACPSPLAHVSTHSSVSHGRYPSDDINKFLWMVRIGGGVFPDIKEKDYLANGQYRIDGEVTKVRLHISTSACVSATLSCARARVQRILAAMQGCVSSCQLPSPLTRPALGNFAL